jgi:hypothetical protein
MRWFLGICSIVGAFALAVVGIQFANHEVNLNSLLHLATGVVILLGAFMHLMDIKAKEFEAQRKEQEKQKE